MPLTLNGVAEAVPKAVSGPIFEKSTESSMVMKLAQRAPSTLTGTAIPVTVGDIEADWVVEAGEKHVSDANATTLIMEPKKVATIILASDEFVRTDPGGLYEVLKEKAGEALALAFDVASLHGKNQRTGLAGPFATFINQTDKQVVLGTATQEQGGLDGDLIGAQALISTWTGYGLDNTLRARLANLRDTTGRRLLDSTDNLAGSPAVYGKAPHLQDAAAVAGWGGDWRQCAWGVGMDLTVKVTDQATVRQGGVLVPIWQTNQVAVLLEASYGFVCNTPDIHFVRFNEPVEGGGAAAVRRAPAKKAAPTKTDGTKTDGTKTDGTKTDGTKA